LASPSKREVDIARELLQFGLRQTRANRAHAIRP
jgi:hypothetical protein